MDGGKKSALTNIAEEHKAASPASFTFQLFPYKDYYWATYGNGYDEETDTLSWHVSILAIVALLRARAPRVNAGQMSLTDSG